MMKLPMPNEKLDDTTVIASVWTCDTEGEETALVVLLNRRPPYYRVAHLAPVEGRGWGVLSSDDYMNINSAVIDGYAQEGGD